MVLEVGYFNQTKSVPPLVLSSLLVSNRLEIAPHYSLGFLFLRFSVYEQRFELRLLDLFLFLIYFSCLPIRCGAMCLPPRHVWHA